MPGQPQLREAGRLYAPDEPGVLIAMVRLEEYMDGTGRWLVLLNSPAESSTQRAEHPDEQAARAELDRLYTEGRQYGEWEIRRPGSQP